MDYMSTNFGADDNLSRFHFEARTNRQTNKQTRLNAPPIRRRLYIRRGLL